MLWCLSSEFGHPIINSIRREGENIQFQNKIKSKKQSKLNIVLLKDTYIRTHNDRLRNGGEDSLEMHSLI